MKCQKFLSYDTKQDNKTVNKIIKIKKTISLLLLLSDFSHVQLYATPSLGFCRQEHWSGLPFPSPMHKSEKWKWSHSVVSDSSRPHGLKPTRLLRPWDFPGKSTGVGCHCLLQTISLSCDYLHKEMLLVIKTVFPLQFFSEQFLHLCFSNCILRDSS